MRLGPIRMIVIWNKKRPPKNIIAIETRKIRIEIGSFQKLGSITLGELKKSKLNDKIRERTKTMMTIIFNRVVKTEVTIIESVVL